MHSSTTTSGRWQLCDVALPLDFSVDDKRLGLRWLRLTCSGLNWLFFGFRRGPRAASRSQRSVFATLADKFKGLGETLADGDSILDFGGGFTTFVGNGGASKFPPLDAAKVDLLERSGQVRPLDFVGGGPRETLLDPALLFHGHHKDLPRDARVPHAERREYAALTVRELEAGKVDLAREVAASAAYFVV